MRVTGSSVRLGTLLALTGGFLDAYTYVGQHGVFANAHTGNVVLFGVFATTGHWSAAIRHIPPLGAFVLGVVGAETLNRPRVAAAVRRPMRAALVTELVALAIVGALPNGVPVQRDRVHRRLRRLRRRCRARPFARCADGHSVR